MQAHLAAQDDDMWYVITDGPMKIMNANTAMTITAGAPQWIEKTRMEYTPEDKKKANFDNTQQSSRNYPVATIQSQAIQSQSSKRSVSTKPDDVALLP
ncbi:hypothetical protein F511_42835 [Dorcoceras hygrometricum]|uniref:Uncharacterized protein n=1 Tax=Dorcoceras hygrometricum TaxID=472368 RepID=A0A2Z7DDH3_9LAMI|nr:hypothetical protein F511_42835 [Dorcoceras hygrometricum]